MTGQHTLREIVATATGGDAIRPSQLGALLDTVHGREDLWRPFLRFNDYRWFDRLYLDDAVEIWLISWQRESTTTLHDHGGSVGAYHVIEGELHEDQLVRGELRRRPMPTNSTITFGSTYIHDVANRGETPAVTLHAYSPPLATMTYYEPYNGTLVPHHVRDVAAERQTTVVPV